MIIWIDGDLVDLDAARISPLDRGLTVGDGIFETMRVYNGEPFAFTLGRGQVIRGWDVGVAGMRVGGHRTLVIAPEDGYGARGAGGVIPPNATLVFEVELLAVK